MVAIKSPVNDCVRLIYCESGIETYAGLTGFQQDSVLVRLIYCESGIETRTAIFIKAVIFVRLIYCESGIETNMVHSIIIKK